MRPIATRWRPPRGESVGWEPTRRLGFPDSACRRIDDAHAPLPDRREGGRGACCGKRPPTMTSRHARPALLLAFVSALMLLPVSAAAAQVSELRPGAYVRIRAPGVLAGDVECTILGRDRDTLRVARPGAAPMSVPLASITHAAVYRGRTRGAGARKGAKWGSGVGLGLGLFNIVFSDCSGSHCETSDNVAGVAAFTAVGAGIGALVGTVVRAERWERVELPPRVAAPAGVTTLQWSMPR